MEVIRWFRHCLQSPASSDHSVNIYCAQAAIDAVSRARLDGDALAAFTKLDISLLVPPMQRHIDGPALTNLLGPHLEEIHFLTSRELSEQTFSTLHLLPVPPAEGSEPRSIVVADEASAQVMGNTGAGKSTLLNAVLGEVGVLPTNAMRACTAAIIEMEYNYRQAPGARYAAEVEFVSADEWAAEVREMAAALAPDLERGQPPKEDTPAHDALSKLRSAYGSAALDVSARADLEELVGRPGPIREHLGRTLALSADDGVALRDLYCHVVDSADHAAEGALWPIVRRVTLRGPWAVLCGGVRLVDAPGLADDNGARGNLVRGCLRRADALWLVSNIRRAVNDKTVKDLLTLGFREAVARAGAAGAAGLAFVATHTDVLVRSEVIDNLGLPEDASLLDCARARNNFTKRRIRDDFLQGLPPPTPPIGGAGAAGWTAGGSASPPVGPASSSGTGSGLEISVFTVSAVDHQKLSGVRSGDGPPSVFSSRDDTEVPQLREFVRRTGVSGGCAGTFKAGAELLRCLEEAKLRAQQEELEVTAGPAASDNGPPAKRHCISWPAQQQPSRAVAVFKFEASSAKNASKPLLRKEPACISLAEQRLQTIKAASAGVFRQTALNEVVMPSVAAPQPGGARPAVSSACSVVIDLTGDD